MKKVNCIYNGKFAASVLIVDGTECDKTTFIQNLRINNCFDALKKVEWFSEIRCCKRRLNSIKFFLWCRFSLSKR